MATYTGTPSTATAGGTITAANWNADVRDVVNALAGAWNSYTPVLSQGASTDITKTVSYAKYIRVGKLVMGQVHVVSTSTGTAGSLIAVTLPVTAAQNGLIIGSGFYNDGGTEYQSIAYTVASGAGIALIRADTTSGGYVGTDPAVTVANTDIFQASFTYEAA